MPLETGSWTINANGAVGQLVIASVDPLGHLAGSLNPGTGLPAGPIVGFWNEAGQEVRFTFGGGFSIQIFTGFLFKDQLRMPGIGGSIVFTLVGYFEALQGAGGTPQRSLFGWYGQIGVA